MDVKTAFLNGHLDESIYMVQLDGFKAKGQENKKIVFLVPYVDDILLIGNDTGVLTSVKVWLAKQFDMKDLGEANFVMGYTDSDFQSDRDSRKSTSGSVFTLGGGAIVWRSIKQSCIVDSTMETEYVAASEASKEVVWLRKFLSGLEVIPALDRPITLYFDNTAAIANTKDSRHHKRNNKFKYLNLNFRSCWKIFLFKFNYLRWISLFNLDIFPLW
ncbi:hypothetical protein UlMin_026588 [Ulmus minor]